MENAHEKGLANQPLQFCEQDWIDLASGLHQTSGQIYKIC